ncbi:DUF4846 domain-containing protein [Chitinophaga sp.]|uniref:DUF4846 domain-containing protein n=2 Tax=Chitinophaga TaxID=79328 RepID=UPI002FDCD80D
MGYLHLKGMKIALLLICSLFVIPAAAQTVGAWPLPAGFQRMPQSPGSFGAWLRNVPLKKTATVYLFNGEKKRNQSAQVAVLDISTGKKDLQQCADAVMRLYAEYLYANKKYGQIMFNATDGTPMDYGAWRQGRRWKLRGNKLAGIHSAAPCDTRACFDEYLETVFTYAGTISLKKQLQPVRNSADIRPGDVFIESGSPGHAVIVMDVAVNSFGEKRFLLAQSYMPAQDMHLLKNPSAASAWYALPGNTLRTPEWTFGNGSALMRF